MIKRETVLVLGAGASKDFGFPTGFELYAQLSENLVPPRHGKIYKTLVQLGYSVSVIERFGHHLERSGRMSVDAFLESRTDLLEIGKAAIAAALIPQENETALFSVRNGLLWYRYLFSKLGNSLDNLSADFLSILTFNYDRSLEHFLFTSAKHSFNASDQETEKHVRQIRIIHLYGTLGDYAFASNHGRSYSPEVTKESVDLAKNSIRIVSDERPEDECFRTARTLLGKAEVVCFLGFGYDPTNLKRLGMPQSLSSNVQIFGTAYGLPKNERGRLRQQFGRNRVDLDQSAKMNCLQYLQEKPVL